MKKNMEILKEEFSRILELHKKAGYKTLVSEQYTQDNIKKIQSFLRDVDGGKYKSFLGKSGPNGDGVDGYYGNNTITAVKKFQTDNNLNPDGTVGDKTSKKMNEKGGNGIGSILTGGSNQNKPTPTSGSNQNSTSFQGCPKITSSSKIEGLSEYLGLKKLKMGGVLTTNQENEIYNNLNTDISNIAKNLVNKGVPLRESCEIALIRLRPKFHDKNGIIVDSKNKLLYVIGPNGNFLYQTYVITGKNKQSDDVKTIARALLTWDEKCNKLGFKYVDGKGYVDTTGKNRKYDPELVYADIDKNNARFLPKGIYNTASSLTSSSEYAGKVDNVLSLFKDGKDLAIAIHGYYVEQPRTQALALAKQIMNSNGSDMKVNQQFLDAVAKNKINLSQSYGCINLPYEALPALRKYMVNSYVFSIGEGNNNYLVFNGENYFNKSLDAPACPSPQSLGAEPVETGVA